MNLRHKLLLCRSRYGHASEKHPIWRKQSPGRVLELARHLLTVSATDNYREGINHNFRPQSHSSEYNIDVAFLRGSHDEY